MSIAAGVVLALLAIMLSPHPVSAQQAPTASISASPTSITPGGSSTLSWSSTNATSCTGDGFSTGGATSGSVSVSPASIGQYYLTCSGPGGSTSSSQISVTVPWATLTREYNGNSTILRWDSHLVSSCTGANFSTGGATTGFAYVSPSVTTTYSISCASLDSTVTVSPDSVTVPVGTVSLTANPSTVAYGDFTTLTWSSTGATQCISSQPYDPNIPPTWTKNTSFWLGPGGPTSGSIAVAPPNTTTYTIGCNIHAGYRNVTVTVLPPPSPPTVSISANPTSITPGGSSTLTWSSTDATSCTGDGFSTGGATSGSVSVSPGSSTSYRVTCTGSGGSASLEALVQVIMPTCTVTLDSTTVPYGTGTYLRWSSSNATSFYIANVGYVTPVSSGAVLITPSGTTSYPATCSGSGGSASATGVPTLTVTPPSVPTATITADSTSIVVGSSTTIRASFGVPSNDTLTASNIDQPLGTGRGASTAPGSKTYVFTPTSAGTYVFYARATTQYFSAWATYGSVTVTVTDPPNNCAWGGITVSHGTSHTFYTQQVVTDGSSCSSYSQARTCTDGALSGSDAYRFASCTCAASYSCSGSNVTYTNTSCETSTVDSCLAPAYCVAGQSSCQYGVIEFVEFGGGLTGHLQAQPAIIRSGDTTRLYWQVTGAVSCSVSGGGQNWTGLTSGSSGVLTNALTQLTRYTLTCVAHPGQDDVTEIIDVLITPRFNEH